MKGLIILSLVLVIFFIGCEKPKNGLINETNNISGGESGEGKILSAQECKDAGGKWNECGSPCAGTDADFCIQVCQVQCECGGIAGFSCPEGFKCRLSGKIADEMGICIPK